MRPAGCAFLSGWATISTVTTCPGAAPISAPGGIRMSWLIRRFSAATKATPCGLCRRPTRRVLAREMISTITPSGRPRRSTPLARAFVGHEKAVAVGMTLDATRDQIELARNQDRILAVAHDLAFALHCAQAPAETVDLVRLQTQQTTQALLLHRDPFLGEGLEYQFTARQRMFVALRFARVVRIAR